MKKTVGIICSLLLLTSCHKKEHKILYDEGSSIGTVIEVGTFNNKKIIDITEGTSGNKRIRTYEYEDNLNIDESLLGTDVVIQYKQCSSWGCEDVTPIIFYLRKK